MNNQEIIVKLQSIIDTLSSANYKRDPIKDGISELNALISELNELTIEDSKADE